MPLQSKIEQLFFKQVNNAPLVVFRIIFGALMFFGTLRFIAKGWIYDMYIFPKFHFTYLGFDWVKVLPGNWMYLPFVLLALASIGILLGFKYRIASILFFICFTYIELIDKSYYLNHYYFVSLIAFLMIFLPAHSRFSYDASKNGSLRSETVPSWSIWIIKLQLSFVYFFAGLAKINSDWLFQAQPLKIWLQANRDLPLVGSLFASKTVAFIFSWFGCFYDLTIPFFLSLKKTRKIAYVFVVVFHILTWLLFPIGIFPWVMIFSTLIFFSATFHQKIIVFLHKLLRIDVLVVSQHSFQSKKYVSLLIAVYLFFQIAIPLRFLAYPTPVFWTEEGFRFSWRVMLMHKEGFATFYVRDRKNGNEIEVNNFKYLTPIQLDQMATQGDFILQYAHFLKTEFNDTTFVFGKEKYHLQNPSIHASIFVSLNGRPSQKYVDKKHDLTLIKYDLKARRWIEPF